MAIFQAGRQHPFRPGAASALRSPSASCCCCSAPSRGTRPGRPADRGVRAGDGLSQPAGARHPDRLPAEDAAADFFRRQRADRRIRRRAAQPGAPQGHSRCHEEGRAGDRGRPLLRARRGRLQGHAARLPAQRQRQRRAPGRLDHHPAGGAQFLPVVASNRTSARPTKSCWPGRSRRTSPRTRSSRST